MVSGSCDSHVRITVVEADVERLAWKVCLYFNLIDVMHVCISFATLADSVSHLTAGTKLTVT